MPESLKRLSPKECFPKMISYLAHEYPDKEHDQIVAIAASECGVSKKDTYGMDIGIQAALFLAHYKEKYPYLNVKDQLRLSYQNLKLTNDFYDSFQVQSLDAVLLQVAEDFEESNKIKEAYDAITDACLFLPDDKRMEIASKWYDFRTSEKEEGKEFKCDLFWDFVAYSMYDFIEDVVVAEIQVTDFEITVSEEEFVENRINDFIDIILEYDISPLETVKTQRKDKLTKAFEMMREQKKQKIDTISTRETENYTRKRQFEPSECEEGTYRTFTTGKGKKAIGCKRKSTGKFEVQSILEPKNKTDLLIEDMKLNLNPSELKLILNQLQNVDIDDKYFATVASSIVNKINNSFTGKFGTVEEEATSFIINRTQNKLKGILYSFYDIYTDIVALPSDVQDVFSQDVDAIAEDPYYDNVFSLIHDRIESDEVIEFKDEKEKSEWDKKFDNFIDSQELNGFINFLIDNLHKIGSQESEDWKEAVKEELETNRTGTGKGWWGESLRHSKARKEGKADFLVEDSMDSLVQWVLHKAKLTTDPKEAEEIAFAIANSNKKSKNKEKVESQKSTIQEVGESYSKSQEQTQKFEIKTINYKNIKESNLKQFSKKSVINALLEPSNLEHYRMGAIYQGLLQGKEIGKEMPPLVINKKGQIEDGLHRYGIAHFFFGQENFPFVHSSEELEMLKSKIGKGISLFEEIDYDKIKEDLREKGFLSQEQGESYQKLQESEWESTWSEIGESFTKQRLERKKSKKDLTQDLMLYHWSNKPDLTYLRYDKFNNIPISFSVHPTSHKSYGKYCYTLDVNRSDVSEEYVDIYDNAENIIEKYDNTEEEIDENELEICFYHNIYEIERNKELEKKVNPELKQEEESKGEGKGWFGESERHSKARKTGKADLITEDATRLQQYASKLAMIEQARRTPVAKSLLEAFGKEAFKTEIESITVPFTTMNTETGVVVQGSVVEGLQENTKQLTPVSSSTVRGVGQFDNELLVQFHPSKTTPQRTYRYQFETPDHAEEAYRSLTESGSPGRWIWQNIRGHTKGEPITPSKLGPAILTGNPTIGGTTASLEEYTISNRTPGQRTKGFEQQSKELKRETSNPTTDPNTGSRIEALLGVRKILREGLPEPTELRKRDFPTVFTADFTMEGFITRSGKFDYRPEGQGIKIKNYDNLKEEFKKVNHLPVFGKRTIGSHRESSNSLIGFAHNWQYIDPGIVDEQGHVKADVELFYDIHDLSGLDDPNELPVSIGFDDLGDGKNQNISGLHHLAVSLDKLETDRCSSLGGIPCNISVKRKITDFIKSKFTKKRVDSDSNDLLTNRTESFYDNIQKESCPPIIKNKKNKSESMGLINKKITEDATSKTKPEDKEVPDEELEDEEETEETPKKKGKKDMALEKVLETNEKLTKELSDLKTSSIKTETDLQNFMKKMEDLMKKQEDLQKIADNKEATDLKSILQKEPYELPEVTIKDMTLNQLKDQKKIFDSMKRVRDFYESSSKEDRIPEVNKELFDMTPAGATPNMLGRVLKAAQDRFQADFPKAKEVQN